MATINIPDAIFTIEVEVEHHTGDRRWEERGWNVYVKVGDVEIFHRFYYNEYDIDWYSDKLHAIDEDQAKSECLEAFGKKLKELLA